MRSPRATEASVLERFPDDWHVIVELCRSSEDFRELCDHHRECMAVLSDLHAAEIPNSHRIEEYEVLTAELEQEIRNTIDTSAQYR